MIRLLLVTSLALAACARGTAEFSLSGETMGTDYSVKIAANSVDMKRVKGQVEATLDAVDAMLSTYRPESELSRFNADSTTEWHTVSGEFCAKVEQALSVSKMTDGAFDITVGPLVNLWGFGPDAQTDEPPSDEDIAAAEAVVGYHRLHADCAIPALKKDVPDLYIDMSGLGKGYAADRVAEKLDEDGLTNYLIEVGGELRLRGTNRHGDKWAIGIEAPLYDRREPYAVVHLTDTAVATSGDYRNYFESGGVHYQHIIDTRTGRPVTHSMASVTVVDGDGSRADALATGLLVLGPDRGMQLAKTQGLAVLFLMRDEGRITEMSSPAFERLRST
jgi:thiamine biosynthesis lipoprotein